MAPRRPPGAFGGYLTVAGGPGAAGRPAVPPFSRDTRRLRLEALDRDVFDLAVVGGGITGTGVARDAALRGHKVLLLEQGDFASGTSSASSKLIHGGLRYLAHGHLGLVYEALAERRILRRIAPHLVRPLDFLLPVYAGDPNGLTKLRIGVGLYDLLALVGSEKFHRGLSPEDVLAIQDNLGRDGLEGGLLYYDCRVDDARLTLENAIDAHDLGAWLLSYVRVESRGAEGGGHRLALTDVVTGRRLETRARVVVNATGPWCGALAPSGEPPLVRPTKGVHVVFPAARLPLRQAVVMQSAADGRILFAIPWDTHTYVGTTETGDVLDPANARVTRADVDYLVAIVRKYFPGAGITTADVRSTWAGVRPLIASDTPATRTSREHRIVEHEPGFLTVAGGKLTTYRRMAAEVVDRVSVRLERTAGASGSERTGERPLPGARRFPVSGPEREALERTLVAQGLPADVASHLVGSYGGRCHGVLEEIAREPGGAERMAPDLPYVWAEFRFALGSEMVVLPGDFLARRTNLFHKAGDGGLAALERMSAAFDPASFSRASGEYERALAASRQV